MTFGEMKDEVFRRINESASDPAFFTVEDVETALNEGLEEISDATEWYERSTPLQLLAHHTYYDLRGYTDAGPILTINHVYAKAPNRWLRAIHVRDIDGMTTMPQWDQIEAEARFIVPRSLWWIGLHPRSSSDSATGVVTLHHSSIPPRMVEDDDEPDFPEEFQQGIIEYAESELFSTDGEVTLSLQHWQRYQEYESRLRAHVQERVMADMALRMGEEGAIG